MAVVIGGDNIISPLGFSTEENIYSIENERVRPLKISSSYSLEELMALSVREAVKDTGGLRGKDTLFVFSTTKGHLGRPLWQSAEGVVGSFENPNKPVVISNACISGVAAIVYAQRLLVSALYKRVVIVGADELSDFISLGFGSLRAISKRRCRPFDKARQGLSLGEAVATIVLESVPSPKDEDIVIAGGAISNDANHISGPSPVGEGLYRAIKRSMAEAVTKAQLSENEGFINPHGTATLYNDQMESVAIERAKLLKMRVLPLKGYYGHTLGASGVLETVLAAHFLRKGLLPKALGYKVPGTVPALNINKEAVSFNGNWFLKSASGFGGSNAALVAIKASALCATGSDNKAIGIKFVKGVEIDHIGDIKQYLNSLYEERGLNYPKFYKMDPLCKAGIIALEELLGAPPAEDENTALLFANSSASEAADNEYIKTIAKDNCYPSPSLFVYTLPSVVIGEISIRYKLYGEGTFFIMRRLRLRKILPYIKYLFRAGLCKRVIVGWLEVTGRVCKIRVALLEKEN